MRALRMVEIDSLEDFDRRAAHAHSMRGWQVVDLDLSDRDEVLRRLAPAGALFLGCRFAPGTDDRLRAEGALLFPALPDVPFDPYRAQLYTPAELYAGIDQGYDHTPDARIYGWSQHATLTNPTLHDNLAMSLHDAAVDDALAEYVAGRRIVGVMGGHELLRGEPAYADAARLGQQLAEAGYTVATGGGPGAMEAVNLGAALAGTDRLDAALEALAEVPSFAPSVTPWARAALQLGAVDVARSDRSLGIPTWFYGHEPPNPFCARVAKYFRNAIREDILLQVCDAGLIFLPGAAGTVQEIFQSACENFYAPADKVAPMVLVGTAFWREQLPAWPLLDALADGRPLASRLKLVDSADEVTGALAALPEENR